MMGAMLVYRDIQGKHDTKKGTSAGRQGREQLAATGAVGDEQCHV